MRMRRRSNLEKRLEETSKIQINIDQSEKNASKKIYQHIDFGRVFGNSNPIMLEIGCGKGGFILRTAKKHPELNFLAVDMISNVIVLGCQQAIQEGVSNIRFLTSGAEYLDRYIKENSISKIYLNFSTPCPKKSTENRRLTHKRFLNIYHNLLIDHGIIAMKTDDESFYEYSLESISSNGFKILESTKDLHGQNEIDGGVVTEYEQKFIDENKKICFLNAIKIQI